MSYSAEISYKKIKAEDLFKFFIEFKQKNKDSFEEIAKLNWSYAPTERQPHLYENKDKWAKRDANFEWAKLSIFKYRWFYIAEHQLLGMFGVYEPMQNMFDRVCYFQNSCDQDYEYEEWNGIPEFEAIAEKWKNTTDEEMLEYFEKKHNGKYNPDNNSDLDYHRRSAAYDEIWEKFGETYLDDESEIVYLSMFGYWDMFEINKFLALCEEAKEEWEKKWEKEDESRD